jgi:hypothetical protein
MVLSAVQHSFAFVHEQFACIPHSNRRRATDEDRAASAAIAMARNPRQIRLGEGSCY